MLVCLCICACSVVISQALRQPHPSSDTSSMRYLSARIYLSMIDCWFAFATQKTLSHFGYPVVSFLRPVLSSWPWVLQFVNPFFFVSRILWPSAMAFGRILAFHCHKHFVLRILSSWSVCSLFWNPLARGRYRHGKTIFFSPFSIMLSACRATDQLKTIYFELAAVSGMGFFSLPLFHFISCATQCIKRSDKFTLRKRCVLLTFLSS